jgi:hypothetical protein
MPSIATNCRAAAGWVETAFGLSKMRAKASAV